MRTRAELIESSSICWNFGKGVNNSTLSQMIRADCAAFFTVLSLRSNFGQLSHHNFLSRMPSLPIAGQALVLSLDNKAI